MTDRPLSGARVSLVLGTSTGGVGRHVRSLLAPLAAAGAQVSVCGPAGTEALFGFSAAAAFGPVEIAAGPRPVADTLAVMRLRRLTADADLVHAHGLRAGLVAVLAGVSQSRPTAVTLHNALLDPPGPRRAILEWLEAQICRRATLVLGASEDLVAGALRSGARDARLAPVAAPPLPPATLPPEAVRAALGAGGRPIVLAVGRLHSQKGYDVLLAAAARWSARDPVPLVLIAGDGPLEAELQADITRLGAPVRLLGRRTDVADLLAAADLVVLASRWEARSLVAQEALRAGTPLVATAVGGMPGLVGGGAAVLVPPDSVGALDAAVGRLLDDPVEAAALAQAGKVRAGQWPTEADSAAQVVAVYAELLGRPA